MKLSALSKIRKITKLRLVQSKETLDFALFDYASYEEYKKIQVFHNKRKINSIWADEKTLDRVLSNLDRNQGLPTLGLCHGTRNGFEQNYFNMLDANIVCIGTDISETAENYENSVCWDFHQSRPDWQNKFDFVYSNSLDHSYDPSLALCTWLGQIKASGAVVIELTKFHSPTDQSEMDPFGVKPQYFPFLVASWFGNQISMKISVDKKSNINTDAFLFFISKNTDIVTRIP